MRASSAFTVASCVALVNRVSRKLCVPALIGRPTVSASRLVSHSAGTTHEAAQWVGFLALGVHEPASKWVLSRSEEHTSELQSLMRISYAVFCLKKKREEEQT